MGEDDAFGFQVVAGQEISENRVTDTSQEEACQHIMTP